MGFRLSPLNYTHSFLMNYTHSFLMKEIFLIHLNFTAIRCKMGVKTDINRSRIKFRKSLKKLGSLQDPKMVVARTNTPDMVLTIKIKAFVMFADSFVTNSLLPEVKSSGLIANIRNQFVSEGKNNNLNLSLIT